MPVDNAEDAGDPDWHLRHSARTAFFYKQPKRIAVAVSGGGDSMALLHLYATLAPMEGFDISAVTVDHGLRPEAADEAAHVARFCASMDIPHQILRWQGWDGAGNLMAAARDARYNLIADWAIAHDIGGVVLGHTQDDLAENFLIRLARKSGVDGLSAMDVYFERHGVEWARPFWQQSRADLRDYLRRHNVLWVDDPSNEDVRFERIRVRKALEVLDPLGITSDVLKSVSGSMRAASDALTHYARIEARRYIRQDAGDVILHLGLTGPLPIEIKRRLWRASVLWVSGARYPPRDQAMFEIVHGLVKESTTTVGGCLIIRKGDAWRVTREHQAVRAHIAKTTDLWDGRWVLDGPHDANLEVRALGDAVQKCPDWRESGLPRTSLIATPAIWQNETLIAAPMAGFSNGWTAQIVADFHEHAFAH